MQIGNDKTETNIFYNHNCFVPFSANKFVNLDIFPGKYSLSKLTPVET